MNTVTALSHSRDACLAPGGKFVVLFDSVKQESELTFLRKEEQLVKVVLSTWALCPAMNHHAQYSIVSMSYAIHESMRVWFSERKFLKCNLKHTQRVDSDVSDALHKGFMVWTQKWKWLVVHWFSASGPASCVPSAPCKRGALLVYCGSCQPCCCLGAGAYKNLSAPSAILYTAKQIMLDVYTAAIRTLKRPESMSNFPVMPAKQLPFATRS